jgi:hypothetical protein
MVAAMAVLVLAEEVVLAAIQAMAVMAVVVVMLEPQDQVVAVEVVYKLFAEVDQVVAE